MKKFISVSLLISFLAIGGLFSAVKAQEATTTATTTPPTIDLACMQTAVEKRDNAIIAAWDIISASVKTALQTRRDALKAAWGISDPAQRRTERAKAWTEFRKARIAAAKEFNKARKEAWKNFKTDAKTCGIPGATGESEGNDVKQ